MADCGAASPPSDNAPPPGSEVLDVGDWQIVIIGGHVVLPEGMTHLPDGAFRNRTTLVSVAFPRDLVSIGSKAFFGCTSLAAVILPDGLTSIGTGAFSCCSTLTTITLPLPDGLSIGDGAFFGCPRSLDDEAKAAVRAINFWAVRPSIDAQGHATVPEGITSIPDDAFSH